jgi:hypothetical protein
MEVSNFRLGYGVYWDTFFTREKTELFDLRSTGETGLLSDVRTTYPAAYFSWMRDLYGLV